MYIINIGSWVNVVEEVKWNEFIQYESGTEVRCTNNACEQWGIFDGSKFVYACSWWICCKFDGWQMGGIPETAGQSRSWLLLN